MIAILAWNAVAWMSVSLDDRMGEGSAERRLEKLYLCLNITDRRPHRESVTSRGAHSELFQESEGLPKNIRLGVGIDGFLKLLQALI